MSTVAESVVVSEEPDVAPRVMNDDIMDDILDDYAEGKVFAWRNDESVIRNLVAAEIEDAADWDDISGTHADGKRSNDLL